MEDTSAEIEVDKDDKALEETQAESSAEREGDTDDKIMKENDGKPSEGSITREDHVKDQTEILTEREGDTSDQTLEETEGREAEGHGKLEDLLMKYIENLAERERDTNEHALDENQESLAESEGDTKKYSLDENQGRPAEENKTVKDLLTKHLDVLTGMEGIFDTYQAETGAAPEWQLRSTDFMKEQIKQVLETARDLDPTEEITEHVHGTARQRLHASKETIEQVLGTSIQHLDPTEETKEQVLGTSRQRLDPTEEKLCAKEQVLGTARKRLDLTEETIGETQVWKTLEDMFEKQIDRLDKLREKEIPTEEDNEGISLDVMGILEHLMKPQIRELHRTIQTLPKAVKDLDFESVLSTEQEQYFDDVTMRDISEQTTTYEKMEALIEPGKKGGPKRYNKEDLVQTGQETY